MNKPLFSWGRYPAYAQTAISCLLREELKKTLTDVAAQYGTTLPFGNGRTYGDNCLAASDHVLYTRPLNCLVAADWTTGLISAEAGMTLSEILAIAIPKGWFLPVTPGTQFITLGGAVANDVHGKNHHTRGTLGCHVPRFSLIRSDRSPMICSRRENADLYAATIAGLGLTGIIEWVELQLVPIRSSQIDVTYVRFESLDEFFSVTPELEEKFEFTMSWIDCLTQGKSVGRGVYMAGNYAKEGELAFADLFKLSVPVTPPISAINSYSVRLFNTVYYHSYRAGRHSSRISYDPFFYPLDRVLNWNRIYGARGFQQYQCAIPDAHAEAAVRELLNTIAAARSGSFLAVLKRFGQVTSPGLLSFPMSGATLALDFPQKGETTAKLFKRLDAIVHEAGGRFYPAKDAHISGEEFRSSYPAWERLEALRDPALLSRFWQRVALQ
jgi:FAD/FMN-containing dehydrogenase